MHNAMKTRCMPGDLIGGNGEKLLLKLLPTQNVLKIRKETYFPRRRQLERSFLIIWCAKEIMKI